MYVDKSFRGHDISVTPRPEFLMPRDRSLVSRFPRLPAIWEIEVQEIKLPISGKLNQTVVFLRRKSHALGEKKSGKERGS